MNAIGGYDASGKSVASMDSSGFVEVCAKKIQVVRRLAADSGMKLTRIGSLGDHFALFETLWRILFQFLSARACVFLSVSIDQRVREYRDIAEDVPSTSARIYMFSLDAI